MAFGFRSKKLIKIIKSFNHQHRLVITARLTRVFHWIALMWKLFYEPDVARMVKIYFSTEITFERSAQRGGVEATIILSAVLKWLGRGSFPIIGWSFRMIFEWDGNEGSGSFWNEYRVVFMSFWFYSAGIPARLLELLFQKTFPLASPAFPELFANCKAYLSFSLLFVSFLIDF